MSKIRDLENAIKTLENVSNPENTKKVFDTAKKIYYKNLKKKKTT